MNNNIDRVFGKAREALLQQLKRDVITIQLILTGYNYERLTVIADLREEGSESFVIVDCPEGLVEALPRCEGTEVKVEFLGKDRVQYAFVSEVAQIRERDLWLQMPEYIERVQRRQFFRISPPVGTRIIFSRIGKPEEARLINISEGGALLMLNRPARGISRLIPGENLRNLRLKCTAENLQIDIKIGKATVVREQGDPRKEQSAYALEFLEMDSRDQRLLQEFVFMCQREILRKRNKQERG